MKIRWARSAAGVVAAGAASLAWALCEARAYVLREATVPLGLAQAVRILHISDLHLVPSQQDKVRWVRSLAKLHPDLVVVTGDLMGSPDAIAAVRQALQPLEYVPGLYVFGSNDYVGPKFRNPLRYFLGPSQHRKEERVTYLPTAELDAMLTSFGWINLNNQRTELQIGEITIAAAGTGDAHVQLDRFPDPVAHGTGAGGEADAAALADGSVGDNVAAAAVNGDAIAPPSRRRTLRLGVTHAPYARVLSQFAGEDTDLVCAGHTHGGQVCLPGYGALVTNCDLDTAMAKGLHVWQVDPPMWLHVSAGLGTSPYTPIRVACRPEATLLTLA